MATSAGTIRLDVELGEKKMMAGISKLAKKAGAALAAAFAVKGFADFGSECVKLGSDLAEVQNVVDVTFPKMQQKVNEFAKSAASSFGLSETMAKKYTGAFGAMAKSFGFTEKEAYNMSTTLTGLSGDVASFYNLSQDEAYTKLKSVFTGETETLKDLGVVMTQSALDAYALANGYGKVTAKMSEQEKVALRYKFVQDQLTAAAGDFARTSGSWANQTRILSLQFDALKASIGQGLINALTPVIRVINTVLGKLADLASGFAGLTGKIFGKQDADGAGEGLSNVADQADNASAKVSGIGDAAKKSAKKMERSLMSFDKINKLSDKSKGDTSGADTGKATGKVAAKKPSGAAADQTKLQSSLLDALNKKFLACQKLFAKGFNLGAGNLKPAIDRIKNHLKSIGSSLKDIFTDKNVGEAFQKMLSLFILNAGKITGAVTSIGTTIAENLIGGFDLFLQQNKGRIKQWLINMFNIAGEISTIKADFATAVAEILSVFRTYPAKQITADIISTITSAFFGATEIFAKVGRDMLNMIAQPVIDNKDKIKKAIEEALKPAASVIRSIKNIVQDVVDEVNKLYDTKIKTLLDSVTGLISDVVGIVLDKYNKYIAPIITKLGAAFEKLVNSKIRPMLKNIMDAVGSAVEFIRTVVNGLWKFLKPIVDAVVETLSTILAPIIKTFGKTVMSVWGIIADVIGGTFKTFKGVIDLITGIFTGNTDKIVKGAKDFADGTWEAIKGVFTGVKDFFGAVFSGAWKVIVAIFGLDKVKGFFGKVWGRIKGVFSVVKSWFGSMFSAVWQTIVSALGLDKVAGFFGKVWGKIKGAFASVKNWFGSIFSAAWKAIKTIFSPSMVTNFFSGIWKGIKGAFGHVAGWFKNIFSVAWQAVKDVFSKGGKIFSGIKDGIASVFKMVVNKLISGINTIIAFPFKKINGMLNAIRDVKIPIINKKPFSGLWGKDPMPVPKIPMLAQGGYVQKNTPQLAMIGDNRHQGEVVSPEGKLIEMARQAAEMSSDAGMLARAVTLLEKILQVLESLDLCLYMDGEKMTTTMIKNINRRTNARGKLEIVIK